MRPPSRLPFAAPARGVSLIELIAVIAILGALAVFALPRLETAGFERYAFRQELLAALRYAQKTALASGCDVAVELTAGAERYALFYRAGGGATTCGGGGFTDPVADPARGGAFAGAGGAGVDLQTGGTIVFDGFGGHAGGPTAVAFASAPSILVDGVTGYVHD